MEKHGGSHVNWEAVLPSILQSLHLTLTITLGALFFQFAFDQGRDVIDKHINQGNLWKHVKHKYEN